MCPVSRWKTPQSLPSLISRVTAPPFYWSAFNGQSRTLRHTRGNPRLANGKMIDVDWFIDINSVNARSLALAAYVFGKTFWHAVGGMQGWPFLDSGERAAVLYAARGTSYNELYNEACP